MQVKSHSSHQNCSQTQRCKSIFVSNMIPKVLTWWQWKRKINFFKIFNTADILIFWEMIIQNKISLIWSICKCSHFTYKMYWHSTNLFPNINSEEQVFQNFRKPFFFKVPYRGKRASKQAVSITIQHFTFCFCLQAYVLYHPYKNRNDLHSQFHQDVVGEGGVEGVEVMEEISRV